MVSDLFLISRITILLAVMLGVATYRHATTFYKLLLTHVTLGIFIETLGHFLVYDRLKNPINTTPFYNIYILLDIPILLFAAGNILKTKHQKTLTGISIMLFVAAWIIHFFNYGISDFANRPFILGSILLCIFYLILIIEQYAFQKNISLRSPVIWATAAIIIYYASNIPTFSLMKVLSEYNMIVAEKMYRINITLSIVHYICLGITFYLLRPSPPKAPTT